jgi:ABC-2 type transport system ATP-binding protein
MLNFKNLSHSYSSNQVLKKLNLSLEKGKVHGLIGLNGSGKTTLLNCLYSFIKPQSGEILWNDLPIHRKDISFLETQNFFYSNLTGREFLSIFPNPKDEFDADAWKNLLDLPIDEMIDGYSTGMKKKLALLCILKLDRPIIVLDEPFNGLDLETNHILEKLISILREKGKTIIITSHILGILHKVCDEIHWLKGGVIEKSFGVYEFQDIDNQLFKDSDIENILKKLS